MAVTKKPITDLEIRGWIKAGIPFADKRIPQNIPPALVNFDSMPDSAYIRLPVLKALYGVSTATIWRNVKNGAILMQPKPF